MTETGATENGADAEAATPETEPAEAEGETATSTGVLSKAKERGEDAIKRLSSELDRNERTHQALERLNDARGRLEEVGKTLLRQLNLAPRDEVDALKKEIDLLEKRLAMVEATAAKPRGKKESAET